MKQQQPEKKGKQTDGKKKEKQQKRKGRTIC